MHTGGKARDGRRVRPATPTGNGGELRAVRDWQYPFKHYRRPFRSALEFASRVSPRIGFFFAGRVSGWYGDGNDGEASGKK